MDGSHVEEGKKLLQESGLNVQIGKTLGDGATKIVEMLAQGVQGHVDTCQ
jgi:succinyl-CoA synthetase beta subunit